MASGAGRLLDEAGIFDTVADAAGDCTYVFATTARPRDLTKLVVTPERAMEMTREKIAQGQKVAVLFGPERSGLENEDIARADAIISVPVNSAFPSLNLGQCVLLAGYEWQRQSVDILAETVEMAGTEWAPVIEVEKLGEHFEQRLETAGFFYPTDKAASMKVNLRNLWSRMPMTRADVQMLHGVLRQMVRWKERGE